MRISMFTSDTMYSARAIATANDIRAAFEARRAELHWLAFFITADHALAAECVTDACARSGNHHSIFEKWLASWSRYTTIRFAIDKQHTQIKQLGGKYQHSAADHHSYPRLSADAIEQIVDNSERLVSTMDVLARIALIVCGVEGHSLAEAAVLMGQSKARVLAAYRAALCALDQIRGDIQCRDTGVAGHRV